MLGIGVPYPTHVVRVELRPVVGSMWFLRLRQLQKTRSFLVMGMMDRLLCCVTFDAFLGIVSSNVR
jgi:hypothetical protein